MIQQHAPEPHSMERALPSSMEMEQAVLGSMLIEYQAIKVAAEVLTGSDFYRDAHRVLFEVMTRLHAEAKPVDLHTVQERLRSMPGQLTATSTALDEMGGLTYIANLMEVPSSAANVGYYASIIREKKAARDIIAAAEEAACLAYDGNLSTLQTSSGRYDLGKLARVVNDKASKVICLADIQPEKVSYLWRPWVPYGKITILNGDPGIFKSGILFDLVARLTTARPMPFCETPPPKPLNALLILGEDGLADTAVPRLIAAGADLSRIKSYGFNDLPELDKIDKLEREAKEHDVRIIVIDPLNAFIPPSVDANSGPSIRRLLSPLKRLAESLDVAIVICSHLNKSTLQGNAIHRSSGSVDIPGAARSVILAAKAPGSDTQFVLACVKNNLARPPQSLNYHVGSDDEDADEDAAPYVIWDGISEQTANTLIAPQASNASEEKNRFGAAQDFLNEYLRCGPRSATDVQEQAKQEGIASATLNRAKVGIVKSDRIGGKGSAASWMWRLLNAPSQNALETSAVRGPSLDAFFHEPSQGLPGKAIIDDPEDDEGGAP